MLSNEQIISLATIEYSSYLDETGQINPHLEGKIGIYAIFDRDKKIQYIGYSRNLLKSLQQHLVRKVDRCYWFKVHTIDRPNRSILEEIRQDWLTENKGLLPDETEQKTWTNAIDIRQEMTSEEKEEYQQQEELQKIKIYKKVSRRIEEKIKEKLSQRGMTMNFRFNPKLKEEGLLDLK